MTATISSSATIADIKKLITDFGVSSTAEEQDKRGRQAAEAASARAMTNRALARSGGRSAVDRGGVEDNGVQTVASLGTGVGGGHPDGSARSGKRPQAFRVQPKVVT